MPIPIIIGISVVASLYGLIKGEEAKEILARAQQLNERAEKRYNSARCTLLECREALQKSFEQLGRQKLVIYDEDLRMLTQAISHISKVRGKEKLVNDALLPAAYSTAVLEMRSSDFRQADILMTSLMRGGAAGATTGLLSWGAVGALGTASTGTAISTLSAGYATNAILAWFGGGSLAAGGLGMVGGMLVLGGVVLGPLLAITGFTLSSKAQEALEQAQKNLQEAEKAASQMDIACSVLKTVHARAKDIDGLLQTHHAKLRYLISRITTFVDKSPSEENFWEATRSFIRRSLSSIRWMHGFCQWLRNRRPIDSFSTKERDIIRDTILLAQSAKNLVDVPLFTPDGDPEVHAVHVITDGNRILQIMNFNTR